MKKRYYKLLSVLSSFIVVAGVVIGMKPACAGTMYQPKVPKHLAERK
jgi:hypothetical protein